MQDIYIDIPSMMIVLVFIAACATAIFIFKEWKRPYLSFSDTGALVLNKKSWRQKVAFLPRMFFWICLIFFVLAYIDPHTYVERNSDPNQKDKSGRNHIPDEGIAIYLVLDNSVSMLENLSLSTPSGRRINRSKIDMLKDITKRFVKGDPEIGLKGRSNDLLGIITFSRSAQVVSPLTLDHQNILKELDSLDVNRDESQRGTALGYAIFKASNLIAATRHYGNENVENGEPAYDIKNSVILLVTDGFQEKNPEDYANPLRSIDVDDAMDYAKKENIRVYIVNIDPKINSEEYLDNRKFFKLITEKTGGEFFFVDSPEDIGNVYAEIDQLEKSLLPTHTRADKEKLPHLYKRISLYHYLVPAGMAALLLAIVLQTTVLRRIP